MLHEAKIANRRRYPLEAPAARSNDGGTWVGQDIQHIRISAGLTLFT